jgi:hypothetical protein
LSVYKFHRRQFSPERKGGDLLRRTMRDEDELREDAHTIGVGCGT